MILLTQFFGKYAEHFFFLMAFNMIIIFNSCSIGEEQRLSTEDEHSSLSIIEKRFLNLNVTAIDETIYLRTFENHICRMDVVPLETCHRT